MKEVNTNNSKKLIIGISLLFCTVILIIGATTAYFTQSDTKEIGNIVSTEQITLEYKDDYNENTIYNRQGLIPSSYDNVITAYNREGDKKCLDEYDYSTCSIYRFSVKNNSEVSQLIQMSLHPTANSYTNLKFILYDLSTNNIVMDTTDLVKASTKEVNLLKPFTLNPNDVKTYELVFYIENQSHDQTLEDSGKTFGAGIRINSLTTGTYVTKNFGADCWEYETIQEGEYKDTFKLTAFKGIINDEESEEYGNVVEECSGYVEKDNNGYYSITIPDNIGGTDVSTIGNALFSTYFYSGDIGEIYNENYYYIKSITMEDGIKKIEDGCIDPNSCSVETSAFNTVGDRVENGSLEIIFPSNLKYIGNGAFYSANITNLTLPSTLTHIGNFAFDNTKITTDETNPLIIPKSVTTIGDYAFIENLNMTKVVFELSDVETETSSLNFIGKQAFKNCNLTYSLEQPLLVPASVSTMGGAIFQYNDNLAGVSYHGTNQDILNNTNYWYNPSVTTLNPQG